MMVDKTVAFLTGTIFTSARRPMMLVLTILVLSLAAPVRAQELAPFTGHRYGGSFEDINTGSKFEVADATSYGLLFDFDIALEPDKQIEVFLSRQDTHLSTGGLFTGDPLFDLTIDYYHIGGLYMLTPGERVRPFVSGSLGLTRLAPKRSDLTTENRFSLALGGGVKFFLTKGLGLRFDVRGIYTALNADSAIFCDGGCAIRVRSDGFWQTEVGAALLFRF
jgi:opacity protein-like surface antigen